MEEVREKVVKYYQDNDVATKFKNYFNSDEGKKAQKHAREGRFLFPLASTVKDQILKSLPNRTPQLIEVAKEEILQQNKAITEAHTVCLL